MATYHRQKKNTSKKPEQEEESLSEAVFENVDKGASNLEVFVLKYQNYIYGILGSLVAVVLIYFGYIEYVKNPREEEALESMAQARRYFEASKYDQSPDSLLNLALNGSAFLGADSLEQFEQNPAASSQGFLDVIDDYSQTKAADIARYYSGISYFRLKDYDEAIDYLKDLQFEDQLLAPIALGVLGDTYAQKKDLESALNYYQKAFEKSTNDLTTPRYLFKAALVQVELKNYDEASGYLKQVIKKYPDSNEAKSNHLQFVIGQIEGVTGTPIF